MYKKTSSPLYANVSEAKRNDKKSTDQNEPTYYNTVTNKKQQPSQAIYSNVNYQEKPNNIYSNVTEMRKQLYKKTQVPLYDNLKPLGMLLIHYVYDNTNLCNIIFITNINQS